MAEECSLKVSNWNVRWCSGKSPRAPEIRRWIEDQSADLICLTESNLSFKLDGLHDASSEADYGYRLIEGRRKVRLFGRTALDRGDPIGSHDLPSGRFVSAVLESAIGPLCVIGVCVPWKGAHVAGGRRNREDWEEHLRYLEALPEILDAVEGPAVVLGDFNQTYPRSRAPMRAFDALKQCFQERFKIWTEGEIPGAPRLSVNHIATTRDLVAEQISALPVSAQEGLRLSDHFGVSLVLRRAEI